MKKCHLISQELSTECGVACIAMLGNISLEQARESIKFPNISNQRTTQKELRVALKKYGKILGKKIVCIDTRVLKSITSVLLVAVNYKEKNDIQNWHWLVYDNSEGQGRILDPSKAYERTSWANTKPAWFHHISVNVECTKP